MLAMKFEGGGIVCLAVSSVSFCSGSLSWSSQLFAPGLPSIYFILASLKSTEVRSPCSLQVVGEIFHPYNLSGRHDLADLGVSFGTVGELGLSHSLDPSDSDSDFFEILPPSYSTANTSATSSTSTREPSASITNLVPDEPTFADLVLVLAPSPPSPHDHERFDRFQWCFSISLLSPYVDSRPGVTVVSSLPILSRSWDHSPPLTARAPPSI